MHSFILSLILLAGLTFQATAGGGLPAPRPLAAQINLTLGGKPAATIIYGRESKQIAEFLQKAIARKTGVQLPVLPDSAKDILKFRNNLIVMGNLATNQLCDFLYRNLYTYEDRYFPGNDGYVIRTLLDPLGNGSNIIVLGGSDQAGIARAARLFLQKINIENKHSFFKPQLLVKWGKGFKDINYFPYRMTAGRGPLRAAVSYLRAGDIKYAKQYKQELNRYFKHPGHLYSYYSLMLWDVMESSGVFSDAERLEIVNKQLAFMRGTEGYKYFFFQYFIPEAQKRRPKQFFNRTLGNHVSRAGLGFYFGNRYFSKYYRGEIPDAELKRWEVLLKNLWTSFFKCYRNLDESYSQHGFGGSHDNTLIVALAEPEWSKEFFKKNIARKMADYAFSRVNNLGKMAVLGDGGGITAPANLFSKLAYAYNDGSYLFMAGKAGSGAVSTDEPIRGFATDLKPVEPQKHLGAFALQPFSIWPEKPVPDSFDKLSFRGGFKVLDPFLLIDGRGWMSHSYMDQNSIAEFSQNGQIWVCEPDAFSFSEMSQHNSVTFYHNGLAPESVPTQALLKKACNTKSFAYSHTCLPGYGNTQWHRYVLFFRNKGPFAVLDLLALKDNIPGDYLANFNWHFLGSGQLSEKNSFYGQRTQGKHTVGFFLSHSPADAGMYVSQNAKRRKILEKIYVISPELKFYSVIMNQTAGPDAPAGMLTLLSSWRDRKPLVPQVRQYNAMCYRVDFDRQSYYIMVPVPGKKACAFGRIKAVADFVAFSHKVMFAINASSVTINGKELIDKATPFTGEITIDCQDFDALPGNQSHSINKPDPGISYLPESGGILHTNNVKAGTALLKTNTGYVVGTATGELICFDSNLKKQNSFQCKGEVLSLIIDKKQNILAGTASGNLYCFDRSLNKRWQTSIPQKNFRVPWFSLGGPRVKTLFSTDFNGKSLILAGMGDSTLQALDSNGKLLWNRLVEWGVAAQIVKSKEYLIAGTGIISPTPEMYVISPAGKILGKTRAQNSGPGTGITLLRQVDNGLLVGTSSGALGLYYMDSLCKMQLRWNVNLGRKATDAVIIQNGTEKIIVVTSESGFINAFSIKKKQLWFTNLHNPVKLLKRLTEAGKLLAATGNEVFILNYHGRVIASRKFTGRIVDMSSHQISGRNLITVLTSEKIIQFDLK